MIIISIINSNPYNNRNNINMTIVLGGKAEPSAEDVTALVTSAGGEVDEEQLGVLMGDVAGKNLNELLAKGEEDLKTVSIGGGGGAPACGAPAACGGKYIL